MIYRYDPVLIDPTATTRNPRNKVKYTYSYYIANWSNPNTRNTFYWYRNNYAPHYYYLTEYQDLDQELDRRISPLTMLSDSHLEAIILERETENSRNKLNGYQREVEYLRIKSAKQYRKNPNTFDKDKFKQKLERITHKAESEAERYIHFRESEPTGKHLDRCRELLRADMLRLDFQGNLDPRGNKYEMNLFERLTPEILELARLTKKRLLAVTSTGPGGVTAPVLNTVISLKIANRLPDFIATWKALERAGLVEGC